MTSHGEMFFQRPSFRVNPFSPCSLHTVTSWHQRPMLLSKRSLHPSLASRDPKPTNKHPAGYWLVDGGHAAEAVSLEENRCGGVSILRNSFYAFLLVDYSWIISGASLTSRSRGQQL